MNGRRRFLGAAGAACVAALAPRGEAAAIPRLLTATDVHVADYPTVTAVRWIGETVARETQGRVRLRLYHSGQLGRESEAIDMVRFGAIDLTRVYSGALNNAFPLTQALCLPYVFESVAHLRR
ncbi:MAG TPA: TRAP transporter substrate-binding protein DctP, partial [Luteimonas sp.]|nr:TRAP transporter substrate-binding protein DctP [Luteimonas sp.]